MINAATSGDVYLLQPLLSIPHLVSPEGVEEAPLKFHGESAATGRIKGSDLKRYILMNALDMVPTAIELTETGQLVSDDVLSSNEFSETKLHSAAIYEQGPDRNLSLYITGAVIS